MSPGFGQRTPQPHGTVRIEDPDLGLLYVQCSRNGPRHVHLDGQRRPYYWMPDGCAACGRRWFRADEQTFAGYCLDCLDGQILILSVEPPPDRHAHTVNSPAPVAATNRAGYVVSFDGATGESVWLITCTACGRPPGAHAFGCPAYGHQMNIS